MRYANLFNRRGIRRCSKQMFDETPHLRLLFQHCNFLKTLFAISLLIICPPGLRQSRQVFFTFHINIIESKKETRSLLPIGLNPSIAEKHTHTDHTTYLYTAECSSTTALPAALPSVAGSPPNAPPPPSRDSTTPRDPWRWSSCEVYDAIVPRFKMDPCFFVVFVACRTSRSAKFERPAHIMCLCSQKYSLF